MGSIMSDPTTLTEAEIAHLSRLFEDNHFTLLIAAVERILAARVSTATGDAEGRPCDDPDCRAAVCNVPNWFAATRHEKRLIKALCDHGIGQIERRGEYDWDVRDVPVDALRDILAAASGDDLRDRAAWERAVPVAATTTAANPTAGDDLRDRVTAVRDKWAAFVFYDVAAMQLRNSFRNDLDDALAVSPAPVVSRPETLREADERRADLLRMRSDALYERWEDGASLAADHEAGEPE